VVKEGRILKKIKELQPQFGGVFCLGPVWGQVLDENRMYLIEKVSWKYFPPSRASSKK